MNDKVFVDYGIPDEDKIRLGLKWGWLTREEADESSERWKDWCDKSTYRRTAEIVNYAKEA